VQRAACPRPAARLARRPHSGIGGSPWTAANKA
jgi:hypothetical protein